MSAGQTADERLTTDASELRRVRRRHRLLGAGGIALALVLLALAGIASYVAFDNRDRANRWQARAAALQRSVDTVNDVLVKRTETLNARVSQLNAMATKVRQAQVALSRSEGDVNTLEQRQRELANEKAQLEDERAALVEQQSSLEQVASSFVACKGELEDVLDAIANDDYTWLQVNGETVAGDCEAADSSLSDYVSTYGG